MVRRLGNSLHRALVVLGLLVACSRGLADVVWKVADEGPRAAGPVEIVGDASRVLASGPTATWELDGTVWRQSPVDLSVADGRLTPSFVAGGRFIALTNVDCAIQVYVLRGNAWVRLGEMPEAGHERAFSDDRFFVSSLRFNDADADPASQAEARRLRSLSFADGSIREEPSLPAGYGSLLVLFGKLHLVGSGGCCPGPDAAALATSAEAPIPFHRLDGDRWTTLEPWPALGSGFRSTPNSLWAFYNGGPTGVEARVLTATGLSGAIPVPRGLFDHVHGARPFEWNGRLCAVSQEEQGNIHELKDGRLVRLSPGSPVRGESPFFPFVAVAGGRLFTWTSGEDVHVRDSDTWVPTTGAGERTGASAYFASASTLFSTVGNRVFRREDAGWTRLAPLPIAAWISGAVAVGERAFVAVSGGSGHLFEHDPASDTWRSLNLPEGFGIGNWNLPSAPQRSLAATADALYLTGTDGRLARYRNGAWTVFNPPEAPPQASTGSVVHSLDGAPHLFGWWGETRPSAWVLRNERLEAAFPGLDRKLRILDAASAGGRTFLAVRGTDRDGLPASLVSFDGAAFRTLLAADDVRNANMSDDATSPISAVGDTAFFAQLAFSDSRLRTKMGPLPPRVIDPSGRFGWGGGRRYEAVVHPLVVPVARVRKHLAAVVDATGIGGTRYRSELEIANFSRSRSTVARLFPGTLLFPAREVSLAPGTQVRIDDPFPDFVGPLAVEFEGLEDESEAWAAVRIFSPSEGGTAGTSLVGTDPGGFGADGTALRPVKTPGSRLHVAMSATNDGTAAGLWVWDPRAIELWTESSYAMVPRGGFLQLDPHPGRVERPLVLASNPITDSTGWYEPMDLLGYLVRNDAETNDGTVVPIGTPDAIPGRRTRFLPAVVGVTSAHAAYRTELTLGWRSTDGRPASRLEFQATYRDDAGSKTFPVVLESRPNDDGSPSTVGSLFDVPDVGAWLVANGVPIDARSFVGTLSFTSDRPEGAAALLVTAVVQARAPGSIGDYGVNVPVVNEVRWARESAVVPGLREGGGFRSNLALANPEPDGGPEVTLEIVLHAATDGAVIGTLPVVRLAPGRRVQLNRPLKEIGYGGGDAWAEVRRVGGTGRFVAYGVVNDAATSDGMLLPMAGLR